MKKLLAAATAAVTAVAIAAPSKAEPGAYVNALLVNAVYLCAYKEGLMTSKAAADGAVETLANDYGVSAYQQRNFYKEPFFQSDVDNLQQTMGGCPKVARDLKDRIRAKGYNF